VVYLAVMQFNKIKRWSGWMKVILLFPFVLFALLLPFSSLIFNYLPCPLELLGGFRVSLVVLTVCSLFAIYEVYKAEYRKAILCGAVGLLLFLGIASFGIGRLNPYIGIQEMALASRNLAQERGVVRYGYYKFRAGENLDIYLGNELVKLESLSALNEMAREGAFVLMVRDRERKREPELNQWLIPYPSQKRVGEYELFLIQSNVIRQNAVLR
jgi:hypothetical protein